MGIRWDVHDRLVRCQNPDDQIWFYRYDPFGRRQSKVRKFSDRELAWTAQKHAALVSAGAREATKTWTWPVPPNGAAEFWDTRSPIVGVQFLSDGATVAEEAPLRLDGSVDWIDAARWHFEPESYRPFLKQTPGKEIFSIVNDHLGTLKEMFDELGELRWAAHMTTWGEVRNVYVSQKAQRANGNAIYPRVEKQQTSERELFVNESAYDCPLRFQGQWSDFETGLSYNLFRHYDSLSHHYATSDPIKLSGGTALFSYVDNPCCQVDPLGLKALDAPGRVQSRINVSNDGFDHVVSRHFNPQRNASQFTISKDELKSLLKDPIVVKAKVTKTLESADKGKLYVRQVQLPNKSDWTR